jgi:cytochrome b561
MLGLLGVVIITGPLMAWLGSGESPLFSFLHTVHRIVANVLFALIVVHILASLKHLMFHEDETIVRMLMPKK